MLNIRFSFAFEVDEKLQSPKLEQQALDLFKEIRCLVCEGQAISDSNADLAVDLRKIIRQKIKEGATSDAIREFLTSRYGNQILLSPPVNQETYLLWLLPFVALGLGVVLVSLRK